MTTSSAWKPTRLRIVSWLLENGNNYAAGKQVASASRKAHPLASAAAGRHARRPADTRVQRPNLDNGEDGRTASGLSYDTRPVCRAFVRSVSSHTRRGATSAHLCWALRAGSGGSICGSSGYALRGAVV